MAINRKPRKRTNPRARLYDASRPLILTINAKDIKGAKPGDEMHCAAANAICRQEHVSKAMVCKTKTYVWHNDGTVERFVTPKALRTEIMIFDRHGQMAGGDYRLAPPPASQKLGYSKPTGPKATTGKPRTPQHIIENVRADAPKGIHLARVLESKR